MWNSPPTNRFHGITLTWPDSIRKVGESDQNHEGRGLIYLVAIAIPEVWPHTTWYPGYPGFASLCLDTHTCGGYISCDLRPAGPVGNHNSPPRQETINRWPQADLFLAVSPSSEMAHFCLGLSRNWLARRAQAIVSSGIASPRTSLWKEVSRGK